MSIPIGDSPAARRAARPGSTPSARGAHNRLPLALADLVPFGADGKTAWAILESTPDAVWVFDASTLRLTYANSGLLRDTGYRADELAAVPVGRIAPELTDERLRHLLAPLDTGSSSSIVHCTFLRRVDGIDVPVDVRTHAMPGDKRRTAHLRQRGMRHGRSGRRRGERPSRCHRGGGTRGSGPHRLRPARRCDPAALRHRDVRPRPQGRPAGLGLDTDLAKIVDEIDGTILEIRSLIYRLSPDEPSADFRSDLLAVVDEEHAALGLNPTVRFTGELGTVGGEWRRHVLFIFRELLSNIARHAHATESTWTSRSLR